MRFFFIFLLFLIPINASASTRKFNKAADELMQTPGDGHVYCWSITGNHNSYRDCKNEDAKDDIDFCITTLSKKHPRRIRLAVAKDLLESCMLEHGWSRYEYMFITD